MNPFRLTITSVVVFLLSGSMEIQAQFAFSGQLVQRSEYRNGYGKLISINADPATFVSQRFRLQGSYEMDKVKLYTSIQDVRTWGSTSQANITDGFLSVHEAWAEVNFDSCWSMKLGRQELNYDNVRFLGNLDWALQARSHDFGLLKYERNKMKLHFGAGYNQNSEALTGNILTVPSQYKTAQMVRFEYEIGRCAFSVLFWNNGKQYTVVDTANVITKKGIRHSQTIGLPTLRCKMNNTTVSAFAYYQTGKDVANKKLSAFDVSLQVSQLIHANPDGKNQVRLTLGAEIISGTASNYTGNTNNSFSPMYGTNHVHNGYMDMFFVSGRHDNSVGLTDLFLLLKYECTPSLFFSVNGHYFMTYADFYSGTEKLTKELGIETDFTAGYVFSKCVSFQAGYSQFFGSDTMKAVQNVTTPAGIQNWAYLMVVIRPAADKKFIGLMF